MKSIIFSILVLCLLGFSSCKKDKNDENPYSSISNLISITASGANVNYYEPIKTLQLTDGYFMLTNVHFNNGDVGIQFSELNSDQELVSSSLYTETGYKNSSVDIVEAQGKFYVAVNLQATASGSSNQVKLLILESTTGSVQEVILTENIGIPSIDLSEWVYSISYDPSTTDALASPSILLTGSTEDVDVTKPGYIPTEDPKDSKTWRLNLDNQVLWEATYGFVREDAKREILVLEDGFVAGGTAKNREMSTDYEQGLLLIKYQKESGNIINTQQYNVSAVNLEWIDMVYDANNARIHLFAYDPNSTVSTIYKITTDTDFVQVGSTLQIDLNIAEIFNYRSVDLLSNGSFLIALEKPNNEDTQNLEWVTFSTNGSIENRYSFNDSEQTHIETVGKVRTEINPSLSVDHLVFPVSYQDNSSIGTYKVDLNTPTQN